MAKKKKKSVLILKNPLDFTLLITVFILLSFMPPPTPGGPVYTPGWGCLCGSAAKTKNGRVWFLPCAKKKKKKSSSL